jgi:hypothetical protein
MDRGDAGAEHSGDGPAGSAVMPRPFDKDWDRRRQWWDLHLWLQVRLIIILAITIVYGVSVSSLAVAAVLTTLMYFLGRAFLRR